MAPPLRSARRLVAAVAACSLTTIGLAALGSTAALAAPCTTYYVSASAGSDTNSGCSSSAPWQTLAQVNATTFTAGNQILFADGDSWSGTLAPLGSGASGSPIVVSSYGSGAAPIIAGGGAASAVHLLNQQYVTVENLEITNTTATAAPRAGVLVDNTTSGVLNGIHLVGNNIHDVLGFWNGAHGQPSDDSGISFNLSDSFAGNGWNDVLIDGNTLTHVDAGGIYIGSVAGVGHSIVTTNVVIQNNSITDAGGNDVVCIYCSSPVVQHNVTTDSGYRYSGAGYWMAINNGGLWQYNEIARQWRAASDGQAFDIDHDNTSVTVQYNYTHENPYGFFEFCCSSKTGALGTSVIRYNISQNDGSNNAVFGTLQGVETAATAQIYNNTIYMGPNDNGFVTAGTPATTGSVSFKNNLIYHLGQGGYSGTHTTWSHNLMYGQHPSSEPADANKITADPKLVDPGAGGVGLSSASVYQLLAGSPALGSGVLVAGNGGLDYFGNAVSSSAAPNIGAYNGAAVSPLAASRGAHWRFDEGSGTTASDTTGDLNAGTLQAGAGWTTSAQMGAGALALTGASNSWVDVPTTAVDTSASYTVSAWVQPNSTSGNQTFASIDGASISPFYLQESGGKLVFTERSADSTSASFTQVFGPTVTAGTWYQLVGVYDSVGHTIKLYVNGVLQGTAAYSSGWKATGHSTIGRAKWNGAQVDFANATIDDVQMLPRAINDREAFALGTGATAYYEVDEGSGTTTADATGNMPNASLEGKVSWASPGHIGASSLAQTAAAGSFTQAPSAAVDTRKSYAVSAWVKLNVTTGTQTFVSQFGSSISPFYLQLAGGKFAFTVRSADTTSSTATSVSATSSATTGTWYHVLGMWDSSSNTISLYVNGVLQGTASYSTPWGGVLGTATIGAGQWANGPADFVNGTIDDVHFYNRTLTAGQITTLAS